MAERWLVLALLGACAAPPKATPKVAVPAPATATPVASTPVAAVAAPAPPATIPELALEPFLIDGKGFDHIVQVEGGTLVTRDNATGHLTPDGKVEWIAKIPSAIQFDATYSMGTYISDVKGSYPDSVDVFYNSTGRASQNTFLPLTGKGQILISGAGGSWGNMRYARVGQSTLIAKWGSMVSFDIVTVRGPKLVRKFAPQSKCKPGEVSPGDAIGFATPEASPQVVPDALGATASGRLVSIGQRCKQEMTAEVWDAGTTTSHLVDLSSMWKQVGASGTELRRGAGNDELWGISGELDDLLHVVDGTFSLAPHLEAPIAELFMSEAKQPYVRTVEGMIYRLDPDGWHAAAHVPIAPGQRVWGTLVDANGAFWMTAMPNGKQPGQTAFRLRETSRIPSLPACTSWLAHVITGHGSAMPPKWTYPSTQKALAGFPRAADLHLVEFILDYRIQMGVAVTSREQGVAVIDYMNAHAPELRPKLVCFTPDVKRTIPLEAK